jgi:hypothetical protein
VSIIKGIVGLLVKEGDGEFVGDINADVIKPNVAYYIYRCA